MRYKAIYVDDLECECPEPTGRTIIEDDEWQPTGLYDRHGNPLCSPYASHARRIEQHGDMGE